MCASILLADMQHFNGKFCSSASSQCIMLCCVCVFMRVLFKYESKNSSYNQSLFLSVPSYHVDGNKMRFCTVDLRFCFFLKFRVRHETEVSYHILSFFAFPKNSLSHIKNKKLAFSFWWLSKSCPTCKRNTYSETTRVERKTDILFKHSSSWNLIK